MKKKPFQVRVIQGPLKKLASGVALSVAIVASVASNPPPPCGDGSTTAGGVGLNACDDGNLNNGDGCNEGCFIEFGFECTDPATFDGPSVCAPLFCGNGLRFISDFTTNPAEQCDDGVLNSDTTPNACRTDCSLPACGDGIADDLSGELCDDGDLNSDTASDACRTDCSLPSCGDNVVDAGEECDDGNNDPDDGCAPDCVAEFCGDGALNPDEACDDGNNDDGDGCDNSCVVERCGDGVTNNNPDPNNPAEQCDDGDLNSDTTPNACRADCSLPSCGDGVLDDSNSEVCDNGALNSQFPNACRLDCALPSCGDGIVDDLLGEQCDDANLDDTDNCKNECTL